MSSFLLELLVLKMNRIIITDIVNIVWIFPAFVQKKGRFKNFFFLLAIAALLGEACDWLYIIFALNTKWLVNYSFIFVSISLPFCLVDLSKIRWWKYLLALLYGCGLILMVVPHTQLFEMGVFFVIHFLVFGLIIRLLFYDVINLLELNIFIIAILTYQFMNVLRGFFAVAGTNIGYNNHILLIKCEILFGLFFCFFKGTNKFLIYKVKEKTQYKV